MKYIIVTSEIFGQKVREKFNTKQEAKKWLDSWAREWKAAGSNQDPRDFYDIVKENEW